MLEHLEKWDRELLMLINKYHSPLWDVMMLNFSERFFWIPFYVILTGIIVYIFRKQTWVILLLIAVMITFSELITTFYFKPQVQRPRPCHEELLKEELHLIKECGGKFGFISSHASNTFALATFVFLLFRRKNPAAYRWWSLMFLWSFTVSYSRIYLAEHYPGDVIFGALTGILLGVVTYPVYLGAIKRFYPGTGQ